MVSLVRKIKDRSWKVGGLSLRTVLAIYFLPLAILPTLVISLYSTRLLIDNTEEALTRRAKLEQAAFIAEIGALDDLLLSRLKAHGARVTFRKALQRKDKELLQEILSTLPSEMDARVYFPDGRFFAQKETSNAQIAYIASAGLDRVRKLGITFERYFVGAGQGFAWVGRILIRDHDRLYGILEEEFRFGQTELTEFRNRHQVDTLLLDPKLQPVASSFALGGAELHDLAERLQALWRSGRDHDYFNVAENRYAVFRMEVPNQKQRAWAYGAIFLPMTAVEASLNSLKTAMVYFTLFLALLAALLILVASNRLVKPIEAMVLAMKRVQAGRVEQVPRIDSTYEFDYLVRSFNDMARNVAAAKRALELKLEELADANSEIKTAQTTLVQSAKMVSLGQLVAGVAHELNNPIGFIYSNMHHLQEYIEKIRRLVDHYRATQSKLAPSEQDKVKAVEKELDIDFVLKDMQDLTRSCLEGANRTKDIVLGLRSFSRVEESKFRAADIHSGIESTLKLLSSELKDRVVVHKEFGDLPPIECNLSQLNQVFMNLLTNAAHAIEGKGDIWIRTRQEENAAIIEIEDTGKGIPENEVDKIFDPFFTTKKVGQGIGLGLSIVYGLIERHHGDIQVESKVGKGTRFTIRLPITQSASSTKE